MTWRASLFCPCAQVCASGKDGSDAADVASNCGKIHSNYEGSWIAQGHLYKKRAPGYITVGADTSAVAAFSYTCPTDDCSGATQFFMESLNSENQTSTPMMANTMYEVCGDSVELGLCDQRLLKSGLLYDWDMSDEGAGTLLTIMSLAGLCSCLFIIVYCLQICVKAGAYTRPLCSTT